MLNIDDRDAGCSRIGSQPPSSCANWDASASDQVAWKARSTLSSGAGRHEILSKTRHGLLPSRQSEGINMGAHDRPLSRAEIFALKAPKVPVGFETIDADGHTTTLPDRWYEPYLDKKYWDWVPRVIDGRWMAEGRCIDQPVPLPSMRDGETVALGFPSGWRLKDLREISVDDVRKRGGADPMDRLELMDEDGVDVAYLYPSTMLSAPWALSSSAFAHALCRAHND